MLWAVPSQAQQRQAPAAAPAAPTPDPLLVSRLVWSTLSALDHANRTGNYSVLRDLGAPEFQAKNNAATLAQIFQGFRDQRIDLTSVLLVTPSYEFQPAIVQGGLLRVRGLFPLRPTAIRFDLLFQQVDSQWRIYGIAVQPAPAPAAPPPPPAR
ncbi:MAG: hypothetical protein ACK40O_11820 [Allosphingosinicella sp.]